MCVEAKVTTAFEFATTPLTLLSATKRKNSPSKNTCELFLGYEFFLVMFRLKKTIDV